SWLNRLLSQLLARAPSFSSSLSIPILERHMRREIQSQLSRIFLPSCFREGRARKCVLHCRRLHRLVLGLQAGSIWRRTECWKLALLRNLQGLAERGRACTVKSLLAASLPKLVRLLPFPQWSLLDDDRSDRLSLHVYGRQKIPWSLWYR